MKRPAKRASRTASGGNNGQFKGFAPEALKFLKDLASKNSKPWFEANRISYDNLLMHPLKALVADLGPHMLTIDPLFETRPAVNKTISKIYRDTRFSRDKTLFKSNMWITFKRPGGDWKEAPAFFFEISTDWYRYGMGFYSATPQTMANYRELIISDPKAFGRIVAALKRNGLFDLRGQDYARTPSGDVPPRHSQWYQKRNLYLVRDCKPDRRLFSRLVADDLRKGFSALANLYRFLWKAVDQ